MLSRFRTHEEVVNTGEGVLVIRDRELPGGVLELGPGECGRIPIGVWLRNWRRLGLVRRAVVAHLLCSVCGRLCRSELGLRSHLRSHVAAEVVVESQAAE